MAVMPCDQVCLHLFAVTETHQISLYRFEDAEAGPRCMPKLDEPLRGLTPILDSDLFTIDDSAVYVNSTRQHQLVYMATKATQCNGA